MEKVAHYFLNGHEISKEDWENYLNDPDNLEDLTVTYDVIDDGHVDISYETILKTQNELLKKYNELKTKIEHIEAKVNILEENNYIYRPLIDGRDRPIGLNKYYYSSNTAPDGVSVKY